MLNLVVVSHKVCWPMPGTATGHATDGGFPAQMRYLSQIFSSTTLVVPCGTDMVNEGLTPLEGNRLAVRPLPMLNGTGIRRKLLLSIWLLRNGRTIWDAIKKADAVHAPIPGDVGTIGLVFALLQRKRLFVRHCGNWMSPRTIAERCWKLAMEKLAGRRNAMLATGGASSSPSARNANVEWIFATSLTEEQLVRTKRRSLDPDRPRIVIACRQEERKGTDMVIKSMPQILRAFPNAELSIAGDGSQLNRLKSLAASCGVRANVNFLGKLAQKEVLGLLESSDLFCFPTSASEGFPKAVLEALAVGLPVITTRVSVLPQLLAQGGGMLLQTPDAGEVAEAAIAVLSDRNRYEEMSKKAIETARQFTLENWRDRIADFLHRSWETDCPFLPCNQEHPANPL